MFLNIPLVSLCLLFFTFFASEVRANNDNKSFFVKMRSSIKNLEVAKKKSELKMARSVDFCRGFKMPGTIGAWKCSGIGEGRQECRRLYGCQNISKGFNRFSETRRILSVLRSLPKSREKVKLIVEKKRLKGPRRKVIARKRKRYARKKKSVRKLVLKKKEKVYNSFSELEKEIKSPAPHKKSRQKTIEEFEEEELAETAKQIKKSDAPAKAKFKVETLTSSDGKSKHIKIRKIDPKDGEIKRAKILAFSTSLTKIEDLNSNSVGAADIAWTPRWTLSKNWKLRGHLGTHFLKAFIGAESETFLVFDVMGFAEYNLFGNFHVDLGAGIQSWRSSAGGTFSTVTFGGSYQFDFYKLKFIDRLFASYTSVGNEDENKELRLGVGVSF